MKTREVKVGSVYAVKVSNRMVPVRIIRAESYGGWTGLNLVTMREVRIRGAQRLRFECVKKDDGKWGRA